MTNGSSEPPISEAIGLLQRRAPDVLRKLREKFNADDVEALSQLLSPGVTLGGSGAEYRRVRAESVTKALIVGTRACDRAAMRLKIRMDRAQFWKQVAGISLVIAPLAVTILLSISEAYYGAAKCIVGAIPIAAVAERVLARKIYGRNGTWQVLDELIDCKATAEALVRELTAQLLSERAGPELKETINAANALCRRMSIATADVLLPGEWISDAEFSLNSEGQIVALQEAPPQRELCEALVHAFPDNGALRRMVSFQLDWNLPEIVSLEKSLNDVVFGLVAYARAQGKLQVLLEAALKANAGNEKLEALRKYIDKSR